MFAVGQKVVCVNAAAEANNLPTFLVEGGVYTVESIVCSLLNEPGITLVEMPVPFPSRKIGWHQYRFRAAVSCEINTEKRAELVA